jgi:hypothetical protein
MNKNTIIIFLVIGLIAAMLYAHYHKTIQTVQIGAVPLSRSYAGIHIPANNPLAT